jgi:hypothetical protein
MESPSQPPLLIRLGDARNFDAMEPLPEGAAPIEPTMRLSDEYGRALLDALTRHYHGAEDTRALRRDYDAERARADRKDELIADTLRTLAQATTRSHP